MTDLLSVYYHGEEIGVLKIKKGRRYAFSYNDEWLQKADAIPISISLPLTPGEFDEETSMSFFSNLLPESGIREKLAKYFKVSEKDSYGLLEIIGGECAGAISILPGDVGYEEIGSYEEIPNEKLGELLDDLIKRPFFAGEEGLRLSLAGAQDKLPVYFDGDRFYLPKGSNASTHIIKIPINDTYPYSVINEVFCMKLAGMVGLPVPEVNVCRNSHEPFYLIERYDRIFVENGNVTRLHQEDFCQALGISPEQKYEESGGPSLSDCFNLVGEHCVNPALDKQNLLKWVMFNILIGNSDSHAKNLSFLYDDGDISLAPFYDLLCTNIYPGLNTSFSMKVGKKKDARYLSVHDWQRMAELINIKFTIFPELRSELLEDLDVKIKSVKSEVCVSESEDEFIAGIEKIIVQRSRLLDRLK